MNGAYKTRKNDKVHIIMDIKLLFVSNEILQPEKQYKLYLFPINKLINAI